MRPISIPLNLNFEKFGITIVDTSCNCSFMCSCVTCGFLAETNLKDQTAASVKIADVVVILVSLESKESVQNALNRWLPYVQSLKPEVKQIFVAKFF